MLLEVKKYRRNSMIVILPKKDFQNCKSVYVYLEEQISDSERIRRMENSLRDKK